MGVNSAEKTIGSDDCLAVFEKLEPVSMRPFTQVCKMFVRSVCSEDVNNLPITGPWPVHVQSFNRDLWPIAQGRRLGKRVAESHESLNSQLDDSLARDWKILRHQEF